MSDGKFALEKSPNAIAVQFLMQTVFVILRNQYIYTHYLRICISIEPPCFFHNL